MTHQRLDELEARVRFAAQENMFHEHLVSLNRELVEARAQGLSAEQWGAGLGYFADLCAAVATFRARWRALTDPLVHSD